MTLRDLTWQQYLKGAMAFDAAPFAVHPSDEKRAALLVSALTAERLSLADAEAELCSVLAQRGASPEFVDYQVRLARQYIKARTKKAQGAWVLLRVHEDSQDELVGVFRPRLSDEDALEMACRLYEATELTPVAQFMCIKRGQPYPYDIRFYTYDDGAEWAGLVEIGNTPKYVLRKAEWVRADGKLRPNSCLEWKLLEPPNHKLSETWRGLRLSSSRRSF